MDITILHEDTQLVICLKPTGVLSEGSGMPALLAAQLGCREVYCVHRLDRDVGGIMVFAKTQGAAAELSRLITANRFQKEYLAIVHGRPEAQSAVLEDLLFHDRSKNKTYVVNRERKGVKAASLDYRVLAAQEGFSLLHIRLHTGRTHQIRVQFASRKLPLVGDAKYGSPSGKESLALWSCSLSFPWNGAPAGKLSYSALPPEGSFREPFQQLFSEAAHMF